MLDITKEINGVIRQSLYMRGNRQPLDRIMFNLHVGEMRPFSHLATHKKDLFTIVPVNKEGFP